MQSERGEIMIEKVVLTSASFIVVYASGRTRIYSCPYKKLPQRVQQFIDNREKYAESYGDVINAIVWRWYNNDFTSWYKTQWYYLRNLSERTEMYL